MKSINFLALTVVLLIGLYSCDESKNENDQEQIIPVATDESKFEAAEAYITELDEKELTVAKSLYYSRPDGATVEVEVYLNDSNQVIKMVELYTDDAESSIQTKKFYYKNKKKYATKEYFEDENESGKFFVERVTYYDENAKPKVTKKRIASFEDGLVDSMFELVDKKDCSDKRAFQVLNQEGEYVTTFQGFIMQESLTYLIVGENSKEGYASSLVVQFKNNTIIKLQQNEKGMIGTPLEVDFQSAKGDMGFDFQALLSVKIASPE